MADDEKTRIQPEAGTLAPGTRLSGIYELEERLAAGGMGEVWRGRNIETGTKVAIKIVLPEFARDQTILALFRKEATILGELSHQAVVRYHVFTVDPGIARPYLAMEFVDGEALFDVMRRGPMPPDDVRRLTARLASALGAVHEAHVFHRDLSPDNVILPGGRVERAKIIDFGIARSAKPGDGTLLGGRFAGKYNYVSPEQLGLYGGEVSERSDIYSLGLVLAAALRGKPLDMSGSQWEVVEKRRSVPPLEGVDPSFLPVLEAMLQPDPRNRPQSMSEVEEWARAGLPPEGRSTNPPRLGSAPGQPEPTVAPVSVHPWVEGSGASQTAAPFVSHVRPAALERPAGGQTAPAPKRSAAPLVALAAVLLIAVGGAGAYWSGAFDAFLTPSDEAAQAPPEEPQTPPSAPPQTPSEEPPQTPPQTPPEEPQESAPQTPPESPSEDPPETPPEQPPPQTPPEEPKPPAEPLDKVAERIAWLNAYPGGDCFHAAATEASETAIAIEGLGDSVEPFRRLLSAFKERFGIDPDVRVQIIEPAQCPVTAFLREIGGGKAADAPRLSLDTSHVRDGAAVSGRLEVPPGRSFHLLLVDHKGMVFNLDNRLAVQGDSASFSFPIGLSAADREAPRGVPQLMVAITTARESRAASFSRPMPASEALAAILAEMRAANGSLEAAASAKFFRLGGAPGEAVRE